MLDHWGDFDGLYHYRLSKRPAPTGIRPCIETKLHAGHQVEIRNWSRAAQEQLAAKIFERDEVIEIAPPHIRVYVNVSNESLKKGQAVQHTEGGVKPMKNKGFTLIEFLIVLTIIGLLAAIAIPNFVAVREAHAAETTADVTTEWHPASWVEGGYDDHNTIVLSSGETFKASDSAMQIRNMTPMEMERGKRVFDWARKTLEDKEKNRSRLDEIEYEQKMNKHHGVLVRAIDYPERIPAPADVIEKPKLHGPSTGYRGPRKRIKSYAGSRIQTWSFMPTQTRYE